MIPFALFGLSESEVFTVEVRRNHMCVESDCDLGCLGRVAVYVCALMDKVQSNYRVYYVYLSRKIYDLGISDLMITLCV